MVQQTKQKKNKMRNDTNLRRDNLPKLICSNFGVIFFFGKFRVNYSNSYREHMKTLMSYKIFHRLVSLIRNINYRLNKSLNIPTAFFSG